MPEGSKLDYLFEQVELLAEEVARIDVHLHRIRKQLSEWRIQELTANKATEKTGDGRTK